jgi:uncharacterized small protein (DUF1192 family)
MTDFIDVCMARPDFSFHGGLILGKIGVRFQSGTDKNMNLDELDPPRPVLKPLDMQPMSVGELKDYILSLEAEIERAQGMIKKKEAHKSGVDSLFGGPKS